MEAYNTFKRTVMDQPQVGQRATALNQVQSTDEYWRMVIFYNTDFQHNDLRSACIK